MMTYAVVGMINDSCLECGPRKVETQPVNTIIECPPVQAIVLCCQISAKVLPRPSRTSSFLKGSAEWLQPLQSG